MNSSSQARKGFNTFLLTLVISLAVFSAIYYLINSTSKKTSIEEPILEIEDTSDKQASDNPQALGESTKRSVFGDLAGQKMDVESKQVLAGTTDGSGATALLATTTPQSTVPVTGMSGPTMGLLFSMIALGAAAVFIFIGPRKLALSSFEKKVIKDLD